MRLFRTLAFPLGPFNGKKPVSKDTNPETFWNNFDKIISITKLKLENPIWRPVKMANMVHTEKHVTLTLTPTLTLTLHDLVFSKYYTSHSLIAMVL
jgi:hypothetical protein